MSGHLIKSGNAALVTPRALNTSLAGAKPMSIRKPITVGERFGRLTVTAQSNVSKGRHYCCECVCICGNTRIVKISDLRSGDSQSCGCLKNELTSARGFVHGHAGARCTATYRVWRNMLSRCQNEKSTSYLWYGGRGIRVCERWQKFENFLADMGVRPAGKSIDRYPDNDGNYEPGNCRWATASEQNSNRRANHLITHDGETRTLAQWADYLSMSRETLSGRLFGYKWSVNDALCRPVRPRSKS